MRKEKRLPSAAILVRDECPFQGKMFDTSRRERIRRSVNLLSTVLTPQNIERYRKEAAEIEVLFASWGVPLPLLLDESLFPSLRVVLFAGGSVKYFARPLLERGIQVVGGRSANAVAVADFCLGQIILSCKGYFRNTRESRDPHAFREKKVFVGAGLYGEKIALLGMGAAGRAVASRLAAFDLKILAVDPFLDPDEAEVLGVNLVTLSEAFAQGYVVSNHLPDIPDLKGVLNRNLFQSMRPNATFINTGRGAQVDEAALIEVFRSRPDLTALLDVTEPEPPALESPLYSLPNVQLSSHIAGAAHDEWGRLGDFVIEEFERYCSGKELLYSEALDLLNRLA